MKSRWRVELAAVGVPWLVTRVLVLGALGAVHQVRDHFGDQGTPVKTVGLFGWDASFYQHLTKHGYDAWIGARDGLRFFPLYPILGRYIGSSSIGLLVIANGAALVWLVALRSLTREWAGERAAERVVWTAALAPGVLATVMAYAEPLYLALAATCLLQLHRGRTTRAAIAGALAALCRPIGVVLVLAFLIDAIQRRRARSVAGALGPPLGLLTFLLWARGHGGFLKPLRLQSKHNLRGEIVDPFRALWSAIHDTIHQHRSGPLLHVVWALVAIALLVVAARKLPLPAVGYSAAAIFMALTSRNLDSFERYTLAAFPLLVAAAALPTRRDIDRVAIAVLAGAVVTYSVLAFTTAYIP